MKNLNLKTKTIIWLVVSIAALIALIVSVIVYINANEVSKIYAEITIPTEWLSAAKSQSSYAIGIMAFSIVIMGIGAYISYAGLKSWRTLTNE
ncbi:hypothetical protein [Mycoplasmopsis gallinarum]|uniref:Uncharacterized protein n=1 Tax=Mycoplasmopsis gallinarum TaxID=29557 RepID=A0A168RQE0_9BACT|nr:hypothetical protein [Mycoplasmopsis gallinarum]OAB49190.1 hypothetical protein MGALLINA_00670 [Mycoplasmopsis gallinarum]